jgi:hypothetical protein
MSSSGPASSAVGSVPMPSAKAARATARASMRSDLPRSRLERLVLAIGRVGTRITRSPRAIRNRSNDPDTCRQSSNAHTRSGPRPRAHRRTASNPRAPTAAVFSSSISPVAAATAASVCELLCMSAPSTTIICVPFSSRLKWTAGGHGLLGAVPRSSQIKPDLTCSPAVLTGQAAGIRWVCPSSFQVAATSRGVR